ncbi:MAG TPA: type I methionyl aminopeptidase [Longimicrobiales bacterium]
MSIDSEEELEALRAAGRVVAMVLAAMKAEVREGVTTAELDAVGAAVLEEQGARSAPRLVYDFPASTCISVNREAVHGIPGPRRLRPGDIVTLDVTVELNGYFADAAITLGVEPIAAVARRLIETAEAAWRLAAATARAGERLAVVGGAVEREVRRRGFRVLRDLCGHGIGRTIHEPPNVLNFYDPDYRPRLEEGMVLALEPIISVGTQRTKQLPDGWTIVSADDSLCAHHEHTIVITRDEPIVLTAA